MPSIIHDSITIISHTGLGMAMFSLGMYHLHILFFLLDLCQINYISFFIMNILEHSLKFD
jgi:hypothetical protein